MAPSIAIIGGGALGLATAVHLVERGLRDVTLLEADDLAAGSSSRSAGVIETQYVEPLDVELRARAMPFFLRLERDHGLQITRTGYLRLAHTPDLLEPMAASVRLQRDFGVQDARVLDRAEVQRLVPDMRCDDLAGGLWGPSDGVIDGPAYCRILARLAEAGGARVLTGRRVLGASRAPGGGHRLTTSRETIECDLVVNAAGPWAARVGRLLGVAVPLQPVRRQIGAIQLAHPLSYLMPMVVDYIPHSGTEGLYFRHEAPGQLLAGLHSEETLHGVVDPDSYRQQADPEYLDAVRARLADRVPGLALRGFARAWAGIYPISPDGVPQVGPAAEDPSIILVAGPGGSGMQLSPILGALAADWIAHGEPRSLSNPDALTPGRVALKTAAG